MEIKTQQGGDQYVLRECKKSRRRSKARKYILYK